MREGNRRQVAHAKSLRATPEELRDAKKRLKELDAELKQIELTSEARHGEERERRYSRVVRLRSLRDEFQHKFPSRDEGRPNSVLLALVMTVASFLLCAFCAGTAYGVIKIVNQKPDPVATANTFWSDMEQQQYSDIRENLLYPTLRVQLQDTLVTTAGTADAQFGPVTSATQVGPARGDMQQSATLTYTVTRAKHATYKVTLVLGMHAGLWSISDLGAAMTPTVAGVPAPPSPTVPPATSTTTPVGWRDLAPPLS